MVLRLEPRSISPKSEPYSWKRYGQIIVFRDFVIPVSEMN